MTATVVRHKLTPDGFAVVVTTFLPSFAARCQRYVTHANGHMTLAFESVSDDEREAERDFDALHGVKS